MNGANWSAGRPIIVVILFCMAGCAGTPRIMIRPDSGFARTSSITVVPTGMDAENVCGKLEAFLLSDGFNVISSGVASTRLEYEETVEESQGKTETDASVGTVTRLKADFAMRFSYNTRPDFPAGTVFTNFTATVVNLESGAVVASADFSQGEFSGKGIDAVLREFVANLSQRVP